MAFLLDYDGTLVPIADRPEHAVPDGALRPLIGRLSNRPGTTVHIVSGRTREALHGWFGGLRIGLWAEHGAFHRPSGAPGWEPMHPVLPGWEDAVLPVLERTTGETPGSFVERKTSSVAWHYRLAERESGERQARALEQALAALPTREQLDVVRGKKVVEIRLQGISKAVAARHVHAEAEADLLVAIGDDETDGDLFDALPAGSLTLAVGEAPCSAQYRVADYRWVRTLLEQLAT